MQKKSGIYLMFILLVFLSCTANKNEVIAKIVNTSQIKNEYFSGIAEFNIIIITSKNFEPSTPHSEVFLQFTNFRFDDSYIIKLIDTASIVNVSKSNESKVLDGKVFFLHSYSPGGGNHYTMMFQSGYLNFYDEPYDEISPDTMKKMEADGTIYNQPKEQLILSIKLDGISGIKVRDIINYGN